MSTINRPGNKGVRAGFPERTALYDEGNMWVGAERPDIHWLFERKLTYLGWDASLRRLRGKDRLFMKRVFFLKRIRYEGNECFVLSGDLGRFFFNL